MNSVFFNIAKLSVLSGTQPNCPEDVELGVKLSTIDRLPKQVTKIYLEDSTMDSLITNSTISKLTVINSKIKVIDIKSPIEAGTSAVFQASNIDLLKKILIANTTSLLFQKTQIKTLPQEALIIQANGKVTFNNSTIQNLLDKNIILDPGAMVTVEGDCGQLNIMGTIANRNEDNVVINDTRTNYFPAFISCLILFVVSLNANILCFVYFMNMKYKIQGRTTEREEDSASAKEEGVNESLVGGNKKDEGKDPRLEKNPDLEELRTDLSKIQRDLENYCNINLTLSEIKEERDELLKELRKNSDTREASAEKSNGRVKSVTQDHAADNKSYNKNQHADLDNSELAGETSKKTANMLKYWKETFHQIGNKSDFAVYYGDCIKKLVLFHEKYMESIKPTDQNKPSAEEPNNDVEIGILKSLWLMLRADSCSSAQRTISRALTFRHPVNKDRYTEMAMWSQLMECIVISSLIASTAVAESVTVSPSLTECDRKSSFLFCDFQNAEKDVYLEPLMDKDIYEVSIYNAKNVLINESICSNISLLNIVNVSVLAGKPLTCPGDVEMAVKLSTLDRLPKQVTKLYLEESSMDLLITTNKVSKLIVINSNIKVIDVKSPLDSGTSAVFKASNIDSLKKLRIANAASLLFQKTQIKSLPQESLIIHAKGKVTFHNSRIQNLLDKSIILEAGAMVTVEGDCGHLSILGKIADRNEDDIFTNAFTNYFVAFSLYDILLLVSLIVNVLFSAYLWKIKNTEPLVNENCVKEVKDETLGSDKYCDIHGKPPITKEYSDVISELRQRQSRL